MKYLRNPSWCSKIWKKFQIFRRCFSGKFLQKLQKFHNFLSFIVVKAWQCIDHFFSYVGWTSWDQYRKPQFRDILRVFLDKVCTNKIVKIFIQSQFLENFRNFMDLYMVKINNVDSVSQDRPKAPWSLDRFFGGCNRIFATLAKKTDGNFDIFV